jgi:hypothetical protein
MLEAMALTKDGWTMRDLLSRPWFRDGVTPIEIALVSDAANLRVGINTFSIALEEAQRGAWYVDGIDAAELEFLRLIVSLSQGNRVQEPLALLQAFDQGRFVSGNIRLDESGDKDIIVIGDSERTPAQLAPALDLVKKHAPEVERVAGVYKPRYLVAQVVELPDVCGQAVSIAAGPGAYPDMPGVIKLNPTCVQASTTVHELAHVFVGRGPTWFTEGIADLIAMRITGVSGGYYSRQGTGLIELNGNPTPRTAASLNQGVLGSQLLVAANTLIGPEAMNAAIRDITSRVKGRTGQQILDTIAAHTPDDKKDRLEALFRARIDYTK